MDDDLEKRIADLEGRPAQPADHISEKHGLRHKAKVWWVLVAIAILTAVANARPFFERVFPQLNEPAPEWMGLAALAIPVVAVVVYFVMRWRRR